MGDDILFTGKNGGLFSPGSVPPSGAGTEKTSKAYGDTIYNRCRNAPKG